MTTDGSSPLKNVLFHCQKNLHNGLLTLRQLVPVHQTLCQCIEADRSHEEGSSSQGDSETELSLDSVIQMRCTSSIDEEHCRSKLLVTGKPEDAGGFNVTKNYLWFDAESLLLIQYLIFPLDYKTSLEYVLIPYLLQTWTIDGDVSPMLSEDLEIALLDLIDIGFYPNDDIATDPKAWSRILSILLQSHSPTASRILVKLFRQLPSPSSTEETQLMSTTVKTLYDKIWQTLCAAIDSPPVLNSNQKTFQDHVILSTLSKDMLPVLTTNTSGVNTSTSSNQESNVCSEFHQPHVHELWKRLFTLWAKTPKNEDNRNTQRVVLLAITTVLCPLIPHLVGCDLPSPSIRNSTDDDTTTHDQPIQQATLWNLIFVCLSQGKSALEDGAALSSILRRRALFLLNTIIMDTTRNEWKQYVMCFETLEMESEQHLVSQIWESVGELFDHVSIADDSNSIGVLTWEWMSLLFGCVVSSSLPVIRKMGMYRILKAEDKKTNTSESIKKNPPKSKRKQKNKPMKTSISSILEKMPPDFVLNILIPSWNSLGKTVGYTVHIELQNRKLEREDMIPMMRRVLQTYVVGLDARRAAEFWRGIFDWTLVQHLSTKTIILIFQSVADEIASNKMTSESSAILRIPIDNDGLQALATMIPLFFLHNSVVVTHRRQFLDAVAVMLANSQPLGNQKTQWSPMVILKILALYQREYFDLDSEDFQVTKEPSLIYLKKWTGKFQQDCSMMTATLATAFVDGKLGISKPSIRVWDAEYGATINEMEQSWAILLLSTLVANNFDEEGSHITTSGQLIWPAINKGLSNTAGSIITSTHVKADHVTRAILLLENGCLLRQLSGVGNGDLVFDKNTKQLMPPPPNIENMLSSSSDFLLFHIRTLLSISSNEATNGSKQTSKTYARIISQLRTLHQSFPSSEALSSSMEGVLKLSSDTLLNGCGNDNKKLMHATLIYAALSSGADPGVEAYMPTSRHLLDIRFSGDTKEKSSTWEHMARSVLFYAQWASISRIIPLLEKAMEEGSEAFVKDSHEFLEWLLLRAFDAVEGAALDAVVPVFNTVLQAAKLWFLGSERTKERGEEFYVDTLDRIVNALLDLMENATLSHEGVYMLNELCMLVFQPGLMFEEYERLLNDEYAKTPIRDAFRSLIKMAGDQRAHINHSVLCRITAGWLGDTQSDPSSRGLSAIPYRDDIVELLVHKEVRKDESATNQSRRQITGGTEVPADTNELSLTRAFILVFLAELPNPEAGLNNTVLKELLEPVILALLVKAEPIKSSKPSLIMKGTPTYCIKMRAWQALCNLSRFVSTDIVEQVCKATFACIEESIHSQIRYFVEIFSIKCGLMHSETFGCAFVEEISRTDLSLQQVASLMIMGGNWIVGRYKIDFFRPETKTDIRLRKVLAGTIPWLSSTQGFSRAIAQLLVYAVLPMVLDVNKRSGKVNPGESDWFLHLIYSFLNENKEMVRLRRKQTKFFESYEVEDVCTPKGVLSIPVDEGEEADPAHLVDVIKKTLIDVYEEAHGSEAPDWKQMEAIVAGNTLKNSSTTDGESPTDLVNFQRKIIPLDALNLAMESQRKVKLQNAAGQRKQQLIVCASLIDKIPNLGGLARTAEIFAADSLIIPDKSVCKMDNFKSISVGAGDWIDIEQVRPEHLLDWLLDQKSKGFFVFGLEQTASSIPLDQMVFPNRPTILLLGKEKEGIPVELLQAVDQCVEIPQLGIIRSLNVHVSGAIAIWEHTKQRRLPSLN